MGAAAALCAAGCASEPPAPTLMGRQIVLETPLATSFRAYVAGPEDAKEAVLIVNSRWGFNTELEQAADQYAARGYRALAIDVFGGRAGKSMGESAMILRQVDQVAVDVDLKAAVDYLYRPDRKVITLGWEYGGAQALRAAELAPKEVAATVMYDGLPIADAQNARSLQPVDPAVLLNHPDFATDVDALEAMQGSVLAIFARHDPWEPEEDVEAFEAAARRADLGLWLVRLDAQRGFFDPLSKGYNPQAAAAAHRYTDQFLAKKVAGK